MFQWRPVTSWLIIFENYENKFKHQFTQKWTVYWKDSKIFDAEKRPGERDGSCGLYTDSFMNESVSCYDLLCVSVCNVRGSRPDGSPQEPDFVDRSTSLYLTSGGVVRISPMLT
jgi:hypothetical protein